MRIQWGYNGYTMGISPMIIQLAVWRLWISLTGRIHLGGNCSHGTEWSQAIVSGFGKSRCCVNGRIQQWFGSSYIIVYLLCRFFQQQTKIQTWTSWVCSLNSAICVSVCVLLFASDYYNYPRLLLCEFATWKPWPRNRSMINRMMSPRIRSEEAAERKAEKKLRQVPPGWYPHSWFCWMVIG